MGAAGCAAAPNRTSEVVGAQLAEMPADLFPDALAQDNFVLSSVRALVRHVRDATESGGKNDAAAGYGRLRATVSQLAASVANRFAVPDEAGADVETGDDAPTIVDISEGDAIDC